MSFTIIEQATPRLHRSELAVPGSNPGLFEKAAQSAADIIFLDVEDAVAPDDKEQARKNIIAGLNDINWGTKTMMVRINGLDTHYMYRDVVDIVEACPRLDMILIPKAGVAADVYAVDMLVTQIEAAKKREKRIGFEVLIETALGMANVEAIVQSSRRLEAIHGDRRCQCGLWRAHRQGRLRQPGLLLGRSVACGADSHASRLPRLWLASDRRSVRRFW
jgi:malyl-CoA/(S)-citramalyl-CoA lyase